MEIKMGPLQLAHDGTHIPSDKSHIADEAPDPDVFFVRHGSPSSPIEMVIYVAGKPWTAAEVYINAPIVKGYNKLRLEFYVKFDGGIVDLNVFETDLKITIDGHTYNLSLQNVQGKGGLIQTSDPSQGWNNTAITAGQFEPFLMYLYDIEYSLDQVNQKYNYEHIDIEGQKWDFADAQKGVPASDVGWKDSIVFQIQIGMGPNGGAIGLAIGDAYVTWS